MKKRKILTLALALCSMAILAVGGTLAYFTDTAEAHNVFTVGNVKITLFESLVKKDKVDGVTSYIDDDGDGRTVTENEYTGLMPGSSIVKDPTVTNVGENPAYIRVTIKHNNNAAIFNAFEDEAAFLASLVGMEDTMNLIAHTDVAWKLADGTEGKNDTNINTYELENDEKVYSFWFTDALEPEAAITLFTDIKIPGAFDEEDMKVFDNLKIDIMAEAIQSEGFEDVLKAFEAYDTEVAAE